MPSGFDSEKKKQKRLHIEKIKTLQKMCGEALKDFESLRNKLEKDGSDMDHSLLQSKINVVKRVLCEMQEVSKSMGKAGYLIGNFYLRKQSMLETARRKGLTKFFITEIPVTNFPPPYNRRNSLYNINKDLTTNYSNINNNENNNNSNNILYNPYTPYQHGIIAMEDYEDDFDEKPPSESPFDNLANLLKSPAHLSVFFHYLISNSDPSSLCLLFITADLNQLSKYQGIVQYLYSIYCTFLQDNATMKVDIKKEHIDEVRNLIELDKPGKKREQIVKILNSIHQNCMKHVQSLLDDFKGKRLLGLGSLFGDNDLKNVMDPNARDLVIQKSLWPHFEEFSEDTWDAYSLCLVSCIATYFKMFGFSPQSPSSSKKLHTCPIFRLKIKSSFSQSSFPFRNVKDKTCFIKEHYFTASKYESAQNCHLCGRLVCSAGDYGLNCTDCRKHYHKACINLLNSNCVIKKNKSKDNLKTTIFSPTSAIPGSNGPYEIKFIQNKFQVPTPTKNSFSENGTLGSGYGLNTGAPSSLIRSLNHSQIDFNRCFSLESSLQPFPDVDLIEEVSLRDTLCLNDTTDKKEFKKKSAIEELVSSETAHVRFLKILHNVHYIPMLHRFPRDFVMLIFPNLQQVITVHNNLKDEFKALTTERNVDYMDRISQILLKRFSGGRGTICKEIFATFIEKQSYAIKELKSKQDSDPELDNFIKDKMNHPLCHRLSLQDLLSKVMQRISKYPMLIKNLIKLAQDCKPSVLERLKDVQWHVEKITSYVNRIVQEFETKLKQLNLQKRLIITPIDNPRSNMPNFDIYKSLDLNKHKLLFDGPLKWQVTADYSIPMHVVLLEEMIVLLQERQPQYNIIFDPINTRTTNQKIAPSNLILSYHSTLITQGKEDTRTTHSPIIQLSDLIIRPDAKDNKSFFLIGTSKHGPQIYSLSTETPHERKRWLQMLTNASQTFKDKKYNASFYYGIDSKRQKGIQKKSAIPKKQTPESEDEDIVSPVRGCEINRMLSMPAGFPEWDALLENMADSDRVVMESAPDLRAVPISNLKKNFEEQDYGFQEPPLLKFSTSSVDLKEITNQASSDALYAMYMEFNKFMEALGTFLAENSSTSKVTTMSSRDLRKWSNELHFKFKDVLNVFKNNEDFTNRPMKRSFSDEGASE